MWHLFSSFSLMSLRESIVFDEPYAFVKRDQSFHSTEHNFVFLLVQIALFQLLLMLSGTHLTHLCG